VRYREHIEGTEAAPGATSAHKAAAGCMRVCVCECEICLEHYSAGVKRTRAKWKPRSFQGA
jgi:hypothetical protein